MTKEYKFTLPIGDWSDDGHGKCEYYHVKSNKSVEEVREIHFQMKDRLGFSVEDFACGYENNSIPNDIVAKLHSIGFIDYIEFKGGAMFDSCLSEWEDKYSIYPKGMANLWAYMLMAVDSELELVIEDEVEMLPFYGVDKQKRHIGFVGYGCFY